LGVQSAELAPVSYRIELAEGTAPGQEVTRLVLAPGESWEATLDIPPDLADSGWIEARLYRQDAPEVIYRKVTLWQ
jgi:hypothetical protein